MTIRVSKNRVDMGGAQMSWSKGTDVTSATTLSLGRDGNYFDVTGTTTVTGIRAIIVGTVVRLHFDSSLTLTNNSTSLVLPGSADITTASGDEATFVEYASGNWRCTSYQVASGAPFGITGIMWQAWTATKTTTYTATAFQRIPCDTSTSAFTLTLPSTPTAGDMVEAHDIGGAWATNNLTVSGNGKNINGASTFLGNVNNGGMIFTYLGTEWRATNAYG